MFGLSGPEKFDELLSLVKDQSLYKVALGLYSKSTSEYKVRLVSGRAAPCSIEYILVQIIVSHCPLFSPPYLLLARPCCDLDDYLDNSVNFQSLALAYGQFLIEKKRCEEAGLGEDSKLSFITSVPCSPCLSAICCEVARADWFICRPLSPWLVIKKYSPKKPNLSPEMHKIN